MTGKIAITEERRSLITKNWSKLSDYQMGLSLNLHPGTVAMIRQRLGFYRKTKSEISASQKAYVINAFFNDMRIKSIMKMTSLTYHQVTYIIDKNCFHKQRSYDTITLVMDSKVNYD